MTEQELEAIELRIEALEKTVEAWTVKNYKQLSLSILKYGQLIEEMREFMKTAHQISFRKVWFPQGLILIGTKANVFDNQPPGKGDNLKIIGSEGSLLFNGTGPKRGTLSLTTSNLPLKRYKSNEPGTWSGYLGSNAFYMSSMKYTLPKYCVVVNNHDSVPGYYSIETRKEYCPMWDPVWLYILDPGTTSAVHFCIAMGAFSGETENLYSPSNFRYYRPQYQFGESRPIINLYPGSRYWFFVVKGEREIIK